MDRTLGTPLSDSVPQAFQVACHHGDAQTNKPTKRDGRVDPLISPLHNADKASADVGLSILRRANSRIESGHFSRDGAAVAANVGEYTP